MIELPVINKQSEEPDSEKRFWRGYSELQRSAEFERLAQDEFMPGASDPPGGTSRRQFLQVMGASIAFAGLTGCRRPVAETLPYTQAPEDVIPGIPLFYATAMPFRGVLSGLLVESHEGRPTKIEGNPEHPVNQGTTGPFEQASVLQLYDPDRSQEVLHGRASATWQQFVEFCRTLGQNAATTRLAVLAEPSSSPTVAALRRQLQQRFPLLRWITFTAEGDDPVKRGAQLAFGRPLRPFYRFSEARVVVSLDADFLGATNPAFISNAREFAASRRLNGPNDEMSRLYVVESTFSPTGAVADHRLKTRAAEVPAFAAALAAQLGLDAGAAGQAFADHPFLAALAADLRQAGDRGLVVAGDTQPPEVHALAAAMNDALGSTGRTVQWLDTGEEPVGETQDALLQALVQDMRSGQVDVLLMVGVNPVYHAPAELDFAGALASVPESIHLGLYNDETAQASTWHIPRTHYLEAWGDGRAYDGTLSVIQPLIAPLYNPARSEVEVLHTLATGLDLPGYDVVRNTWQQEGRLQGDFEESWRRLLHDGFLPDTQYPVVTVSAAPVGVPQPAPIGPDDLELVYRLDPTVLDGEFSNVSWMQELPDPMTKVTWDNVAVMSAATAERLGVSVEYGEGKHYADLVEIAVDGRSVTLPVWIVPGYPDNSIGVTLGYGRQIEYTRSHRKKIFFDKDADTDVYGTGALANGVGVNVSPLRSARMERVSVGVQVRPVGRRQLVASAQEHWAMEGRPIVRMASLDEFKENPQFARNPLMPSGEHPPLWQERIPYDDPRHKDSLYYVNQWGMTIDLNTCIGCNACVVACNSENNIPVVGKEQVSLGREMHWLRIDRYYVSEEGNKDNPKAVFQPMLCQHCEYAPCEPVCPVAATTHSADGLNEMTYNRCIGTRYCSNNCPYKVRRFNYFNWTKTMPLQVQMAMNPDVTVRFRGVIEKCTYCVQRIREGQRRANLEDRPIRDGEVQTACQQACPTNAIVFGDLRDPASRVAVSKQNVRRYEVLDTLNTQPRTSYLAYVDNPNRQLVDA